MFPNYSHSHSKMHFPNYRTIERIQGWLLSRLTKMECIFGREKKEGKKKGRKEKKGGKKKKRIGFGGGKNAMAKVRSVSSEFGSRESSSLQESGMAAVERG